MQERFYQPAYLYVFSLIFRRKPISPLTKEASSNLISTSLLWTSIGAKTMMLSPSSLNPQMWLMNSSPISVEWEQRSTFSLRGGSSFGKLPLCPVDFPLFGQCSLDHELMSALRQLGNYNFWSKNWKGLSHNMETFHKKKSGVFNKNPKKRKI